MLSAAMLATLLSAPLMMSSFASAADAELPSRRVSYAGLDLSKPDDAALFKQRLTAAAEKVCRPESQSVALRLRRMGERCMADAIARALGRLDDTTLSAKWLANGGR